MVRKAFSILELVFIIVMLGIMAGVSLMYIPQTKLRSAAEALIQNIKYTKSLAQLDDRYFTMEDESVSSSVDTNVQSEFWKAGMWQIQFHMTTDDYGYSIYADTGRSASSTNFDGRPMSGDLIAKDSLNKACLSSYSESNLPSECENNRAAEAQLTKTYDVTIDSIQYDSGNNTNCSSSNSTTKRIYFDKAGLPYCGSVTINGTNSVLPERLTGPVKITLKRRNQTATICVSKGGLVYGSSDGQCDVDS